MHIDDQHVNSCVNEIMCNYCGCVVVCVWGLQSCSQSGQGVCSVREEITRLDKFKIVRKKPLVYYY